MAEDKYVTFRVGEEWLALYVDGKLSDLGDAYMVMENLLSRLGVAEEQSEVMYRIQSRDDVPATLDELREREADLEATHAVAATLRERAAELIEQARKLEEGQ